MWNVVQWRGREQEQFVGRMRERARQQVRVCAQDGRHHQLVQRQHQQVDGKVRVHFMTSQQNNNINTHPAVLCFADIYSSG